MDGSFHSLVASQMSTPITSSALAQAQTSSTNHPNPTLSCSPYIALLEDCWIVVKQITYDMIWWYDMIKCIKLNLPAWELTAPPVQIPSWKSGTRKDRNERESRAQKGRDERPKEEDENRRKGMLQNLAGHACLIGLHSALDLLSIGLYIDEDLYSRVS